jgi:hydrogenase large subunit
MPQTITMGPVTRIEGHLDIEVTIEAVAGVQTVVDARCAGTMFRGFEMILKGRNPRDAIHITQRICGVCPTSHAVVASKCLEASFGPQATPPDNGRILRNLILGADFLQSHILSFYQLAMLDYVDETGIFGQAPATLRFTAADMVSGEEAKQLATRYMEAIDMRRKMQQLGAVFGGRMPCSPVFVAGGCTQTLADVINMATVGTLTGSQRISHFQNLLREILSFIDSGYLPDVQFLTKRFSEYSEIGRGCGNLLAFGAFDLDASGSRTLLPCGVFSENKETALDPDKITEHVRYSRYGGATEPSHPAAADTQPDLEKSGAYSWIKAPRYSGRAHEVGPLARMWISGNYRRGISVMDRLMARAMEARAIAAAMLDWVGQLQVGAPTRAEFKYPSSGVGVGLMEAPRGALGHWVQFRRHAIQHYQILTPTAWNASPRDDNGENGPLEQALIGTPVRDQNRPIECLRVVHSFDPCLACSVH